MYTYDAITKTGLLIHLSMNVQEACYIFIFDIYTQQFNMKFFTNVESAKQFIKNI
jgi:hypothetical protein